MVHMHNINEMMMHSKRATRSGGINVVHDE